MSAKPSARKLQFEILVAKTSSLQEDQASIAFSNATEMALVQTNPEALAIKPEAKTPAIDSSDWPLLLKNYTDRMPPSLRNARALLTFGKFSFALPTLHLFRQDALLTLAT
jgi:hypothetical protein